ncbi:MAG: hypothetical protein ACYS6W_17800 [Planctomycetota bacterium]|jgi:hypothetical protein
MVLNVVTVADSGADQSAREAPVSKTGTAFSIPLRGSYGREAPSQARLRVGGGGTNG